MLKTIIFMIIYVIVAPFIGGLLDGCDRKISARMQGRKGPGILQPFYDVRKLFGKQLLSVNSVQLLLIISYLLFIIFTGCLFFGGMNMLMCFFALTTASIFLVLAATCTSSPFSTMSAQRELLQMMCDEPMVLLTAVGFYMATGSFNVYKIAETSISPILYLPGIFVGFLFILTIKMRKSPFDVSTSHHPHQEMVHGISLEMAGPMYAYMNIAEWYENVFLLGVVAMFIINDSFISKIVAVVVCLITWFIEIVIDNTSARVRWDVMFKLSWGVTLLAAGLNLLVLSIL